MIKFVEFFCNQLVLYMKVLILMINNLLEIGFWAISFFGVFVDFIIEKHPEIVCEIRKKINFLFFLFIFNLLVFIIYY